VERLSATLPIANKLGLHARAAAKLVEAAARFQSVIQIRKDGETVDARSILGLMMLNARVGSEIEVTADGPDANDALAAVVALIQAKFGEE
jgi:phosphocarrier protein